MKQKEEQSKKMENSSHMKMKQKEAEDGLKVKKKMK
ncbi:MAG: hypothetical protein ACJAU6_004033 [Alphaproteobacteria bacterium]|jgi:hypothetical protein